MFSFIKAPRAIGLVVLAGLLAGGATSALAQTAPSTSATCDAPTLNLANPSPGDMLMPGGYDIQGTAFDPRAQPASGIDKVSIFLDSRDSGGIDLGEVTPGAPNLNLETPAVPSVDGFNLVVNLPNVQGAHNLVAYARSSLSGQETSVSVPIVLGEDPSKLGIVPGTATESTTSPCPASTTTTTAPTTTTTAPATTPAAVANTPSPSVSFDLANPHSGDVLLSGAYAITGMASGIDRVSIFLDSRDAGGTELAQVTPTGNEFSVTVQLPANRVGGHTLVAYAHNAASGAETVASVPITLER